MTRSHRHVPKAAMLAPLAAFLAFFLAFFALAPLRPAAAQAQPAAPACTAPAGLAQLNRALPHFAERVALGGPVTVIAIGSSSTAGAGATSSAASYPSRLEVALKARFPGVAITVLNRGVNGEEIR